MRATMHARKTYRRLLLSLLHSSFLFTLSSPAITRGDERDAFFANHTIPRIRILLDTNAMAALRNKYREYVKCSVIEESITNRDVGIHLKGQYGTFEAIDGQPSLTLNFDKFVKGQSFHGLDKFHLNNSAQDPSLLCEVIGREMFQAAGVPTPRATHARVCLNGRDLGLYVLVEGTDKSFLKRHFVDTSGNLYDSGFRHDITDALEKKSGKGPNDHSDLHALFAAAREPNQETRIARLAALIDLDRFYTLLALESMMRHFDGYAMSVNNYRVYYDPESGRAVFLPHGMDQLFYQPQAALLGHLKGTLAMAVLQTQTGRREFRSRCATVFTNSLAQATNDVEAARARIRRSVAELGAGAIFKQEQAVTNLLRRIQERTEHLKLELSEAFVVRPNFALTNQVQLTNWLVTSDSGKPVLSRTNANGQELLLIHSTTSNSYSARLQIRAHLPVGAYHLFAQIMASEPVFRGSQQSVSLRAWGMDDVETETVRRDARTLELRGGFEIAESTNSETLIECRILSKPDISYRIDSFFLLKND